MSIASELRRLADRLDMPGFAEARRLKVPPGLYRFFDRVKHLAEPRTVIDVGANRGQFARAAAVCFPQAVVHAFEPLTVCHEQLRQVAGALPQITIHPFALGDSTGMVEMFQNDYSPSSSLLPMEQLHRELWPKTANTKSISVPLDTLDNVTARRGVQGPVFLKLDVQGFELRVLRGAKQTLQETSIVMSEVLFEGLYEGQADLRTLTNFLADQGFRFLEFAEERRLPPLERLVYADAVFVKESLKFP